MPDKVVAYSPSRARLTRLVSEQAAAGNQVMAAFLNLEHAQAYSSRRTYPLVGEADGAAAPPAPVAFSVPQVSAPVYKPPKVKKKRRPFRLLLPLVLILLLAGGAFYAYNRFFSGPALAVTAATAETTHGGPGAVGHCPTASFDFTGTIQTNGGAGDITYQWIQPDGTPAQETTQSVNKGQTSIPASLHFTYKGNGSANGDKTQLKVLKPSAVDSNVVPVQYRCP